MANQKPTESENDAAAMRAKAANNIPLIVASYFAVLEEGNPPIRPTSDLPVPKHTLKFALKVMWLASPPDVRRLIEDAYLQLGRFQEGADMSGSISIPAAPPTSQVERKKLLGPVESLVDIIRKMGAETDYLRQEVASFKEANKDI